MAKEYIEREATIELLRSIGSRDYRREKGTIQEAIKMVSFSEYTPAADVVEVRHGKWRWVAYDANPKIGNWHCTYCNRIPKSFQKEDFCPNCGAKMDEERK